MRKEKGIKAVTLCFTDIEGRLHMLDYDKKFLLDSLSNLTFDGSSIRGFTPQHESDLRLEVDLPHQSVLLRHRSGILPASAATHLTFTNLFQRRVRCVAFRHVPRLR